MSSHELSNSTVGSGGATRLDSSSSPGDTISENALLLRDASLTIKEDFLVIFDKSIPTRKQKGGRQGCCGIFSSPDDDSTRAIPLYNVLWADATDTTFSLNLADPIGTSSKVIPRRYSWNLTPDEADDAKQWASRLLSLSYGDAQIAKRCKVIINPFGGSGLAKRLWQSDMEALLTAAQCTLDVQDTTHHEHAIEIAENLDIDKYDAVICVSGDGVVHEVFNGFGRRPDAQKALRNVAVAQLCGGSGNAMCWNLTGSGVPSAATLAVIKGVRSRMDLVSVTQGDKRTLSFLSQTVGIVAEVDLGTENMRWMGSTRFTVGFLQRILREAVYPCEVAVKIVHDDKEEVRRIHRENPAPSTAPLQLDDKNEGIPPLKFGTVNDRVPHDWTVIDYPEIGNFFVGKMAIVSEKTNFLPAARPNDGLLDMVCIQGTIGRRKALELLMALETGEHFNMPEVKYRKVVGFRITPKNQDDGYISIDGERVPFAPFQAEVHPGLATVLSKKRNGYENKGP